jgi:cbb3-type cytochrome oxidase subunit 3
MDRTFYHPNAPYWRLAVFFLTTALIGLLSWDAEAQTPEAVRYNQANDLYRKGAFEAAARGYADLADAGHQNLDLYYNLANSWFKAGSLGNAILWYERALRLSPGDPDVLANLRFTRARLVDRAEEEDLLPGVQLLTMVYRRLDPDWLLIFCTAMLFLAGVGGILWLFRPERRTLWTGITVVLLAGWLVTGIAWEMRSGDLSAPEAVVMQEEVVGKSGPGSDYLEVFALHEGTKVTVERRESDWLLVRLENGLGGWVRSEGVERI